MTISDLVSRCVDPLHAAVAIAGMLRYGITNLVGPICAEPQAVRAALQHSKRDTRLGSENSGELEPSCQGVGQSMRRELLSFTERKHVHSTAREHLCVIEAARPSCVAHIVRILPRAYVGLVA